MLRKMLIWFWGKMMLCSDEIFWGKIVSGNLPPWLLTTLWNRISRPQHSSSHVSSFLIIPAPLQVARLQTYPTPKLKDRLRCSPCCWYASPSSHSIPSTLQRLSRAVVPKWNCCTLQRVSHHTLRSGDPVMQGLGLWEIGHATKD